VSRLTQAGLIIRDSSVISASLIRLTQTGYRLWNTGAYGLSADRRCPILNDEDDVDDDASIASGEHQGAILIRDKLAWRASYLAITALISRMTWRVSEGCGPVSRRGSKGARQKRQTAVGEYAPTSGGGGGGGGGEKSFSDGLKFHSAVSQCEAAKPGTQRKRNTERERERERERGGGGEARAVRP